MTKKRSIQNLFYVCIQVVHISFNEKIKDLIKTKKVCTWYMSGRMGERGDTPVLFSENLASAYGRTYYQYKSYAKFEFQLSCKM